MSHIGKPPCDSAVILSGKAGTTCPASSRRWTLVAAIIGSGLAFVDGTVVNMDPFYRAFGVKPGDAMYRAPSQRVTLY